MLLTGTTQNFIRSQTATHKYCTSYQRRSEIEDDIMDEQRAESIRKLTGIFHIAEIILSHLDAESLRNASRVSPYWRYIIREGCLWKKLTEKKVASDSAWAKFERQHRSLARHNNQIIPDEILHDRIEADVDELNSRWRSGYSTKVAQVIEYWGRRPAWFHGNEKLTHSSNDSLQIINLDTGLCVQSYQGAIIPNLLRIKFDHRMIICAYFDGEIRVWDRNDPNGSGPCSTLQLHDQPIHNFVISDNIMIAWAIPSYLVCEIHSPKDIRFVESFSCQSDHSGRFYEFANKRIMHIFAGNIELIDSKMYEFMKSSNARSIVYKSGLAATVCEEPGFGWKIKLWDIKSETCMRTLEIQEMNSPLVSFDAKHFAAAWEGDLRNPMRHEIRIWDIGALLDRNIPNEELASVTIEEDYDYVKRLRYNGVDSVYIGMEIDEFRIKCFSELAVTIFDFRNPRI